ncbi:MAG: PKD domain-containing protein [Halobacteriales archaeon]
MSNNDTVRGSGESTDDVGLDIERRTLIKGAATGILAGGGLAVGSDLASAQTFQDLCEAIPLDVVVVLDRSLSMLSEQNKFSNAQSGAQTFVGNLDANDRAALVPFNDSASVAVGLTSNLGSVQSAIGGLTANGGTDIAAAVNTAQTHLGTNLRPDATPIMVLLSDGVSNPGPALTAANNAKSAGTRLITIAYGDFADPTLLENMASTPKSRNFFDADTSDIQDVFATISQEVCPVEIEIDIRPNVSPNVIEPSDPGTIPVAVIHTDDFDATTIDPSTVRFGSPSTIAGGGGASVASGTDQFTDIVGDSRTDFLADYAVPDTGFTAGSSEGWLVAETTGGQLVAGRDSVTPNQAPTPVIGHTPQIPQVNEPVQLDGTGSSDPNTPVDSIASYDWDFGDGGGFQTGLGPTPTFAYASPGMKTVTLRVTDGFGISATTSETFRVNAPPTAAIDIQTQPPLRFGDPIDFDGSNSSDPDGTISAYEWDVDGDGFDDGTAASITHTYPAGTDYTQTVRLRVTDNDGGTDMATVDIQLVLPIDIDVIPTINPKKRKGVIPVEVPPTPDFDPADLDLSTVRFGDPDDVAIDNTAGARPAHDGHLKGNGRLMLHFPAVDADFEGDESVGTLVGELNGGTPVLGTGPVEFTG